MEEFKQFMDMTKTTYNDSMRKWKEDGGQILGYYCSYVPQELIIAAGMLPFRLRAPESTGTTLSDRYMTYQNCTFCRHVADEALQGRYDFLSGFIGTNGCDQSKRIADVLNGAAYKEEVGSKKFFSRFISAPRVPEEGESVEYYKRQLIGANEALEQHFGVEITEQKLRDAIKIVNESRSLLREIYELRKADQPPITGAEMLALTIGYTCMPKETFNDQLRTIISKMEGRVAAPDHTKRIFLYGPELDNPEFVRIIEDQGGLVVADGLCFGLRQAWQLVDESMDPIEALARRHLLGWSCPRMTDPTARMENIHEVVKDWHVDGIIGARIIFCQPWAAEKTLTDFDSKETNTPTLWLEREYKLGAVGQMKTRVQAFMESMEA